MDFFKTLYNLLKKPEIGFVPPHPPAIDSPPLCAHADLLLKGFLQVLRVVLQSWCFLGYVVASGTTGGTLQTKDGRIRASSCVPS